MTDKIQHFIGSRQRSTDRYAAAVSLVDCLVWKRGDRAIRVNLQGGAFWQRGQLLKMRQGGKRIWYWSRLPYWNDATGLPTGFGDHAPWLFSKENIRWIGTIAAVPRRPSHLTNVSKAEAAGSTTLYKRDG